MPGMSLTLLKLPADGAARETTLARLDSPTTAPGWVPAAPRVPAAPVQVPPSTAIGDGGTPPGPAISAAAAAGLRSAITAAAEAVVAAEDQLTEWDRVAGDGDAGITFRRGAEQVLADVSDYIVDHPCAALEQIADSIREAQGGTSVRRPASSLPPCSASQEHAATTVAGTASVGGTGGSGLPSEAPRCWLWAGGDPGHLLPHGRRRSCRHQRIA